MAKVKDLSNKQLMALMSKYQKLLSGLRQERAKRLEQDPDQKELYSNEAEWSQRQKDRWQTRSKETRAVELSEEALFQLSLEDKDIASNEKQHPTHEIREDEVGVTTLLSLSNEEIKKLKK